MEKTIRLSETVGSGYADFWNCRKRYRVVIGGRASKKSTTTALWFIANIMKYKGANALVVRKVYKDHKDSTFAQLRWAINTLGVDDLWDCRLSPIEIVYRPTGQKILFRGLDDPMSITSMTVSKGYLCWVWWEEFFQVTSEADFNMVDGSIRGTMPSYLWKQHTGTMNPWNEKHWIKKRFFDNPDEDTFTLKTDYTCNEFIDSSDRKFFEDMRIKNPRRFNVEGLGNWGVAEGLIYDNWKEAEFSVPELMAKKRNLKSAFGLDFGYTSDPSALICMAVDETWKEIYIFDEHYQRGMLNNEIAGMITMKGYSKEVIIADCSEPKSIEEIKRYGIGKIRAARKGKDSIVNGIQFVKQFKIYVHPKCTSTILELNNYAWETKEGRLTNTPVDGYNHLMDAIRYGLERFMVKSNIWLLNSRVA